MSARYRVRRTLQNLWEIEDAYRDVTEFVLFADIGLGHARMWATNEVLQHGGRSEALRLLAHDATRAGVDHSFVPPPRLSRVVWDGS